MRPDNLEKKLNKMLLLHTFNEKKNYECGGGHIYPDGVMYVCLCALVPMFLHYLHTAPYLQETASWTRTLLRTFHIQVIQFIFPHKGPASPAWDNNIQHFPAKKKNGAIIRTCSLNTVNHLPFRLRFFFCTLTFIPKCHPTVKRKTR